MPDFPRPKASDVARALDRKLSRARTRLLDRLSQIGGRAGHTERRRSPRQASSGLLHLSTRDAWRTVLLIDVSSHGARFHCAEVPRLGTRLRLALRVPCQLLRLMGRVVRHERPGVAAVEFDPLTWAQQGLLRALDPAADVPGDHHVVLLMIDDLRTRSAIGQAVRDCGYRAIVCATPLDVIQGLVEPGLALRAAIVSAGLPGRGGQDVLGFLAQECPDVVRALLVKPPWAGRHCRDGESNWLVSRVDEIPPLLATLATRRAS